MKPMVSESNTVVRVEGSHNSETRVSSVAKSSFATYAPFRVSAFRSEDFPAFV